MSPIRQQNQRPSVYRLIGFGILGNIGAALIFAPAFGWYLWKETHSFHLLKVFIVGLLVAETITTFILYPLGQRILSHVKRSDKLAQESLLDPLTGLHNRRAFQAYFKDAWNTAMRHESGLAFMLVDLDGFKKLNDTQGHGAGDAALISIAQTLMDTCQRSGDYVARVGGDEFFVMTELVTPQKAYAFAVKLQHAVESLGINSCLNDGPRIPVTASIGLTCFSPRQAETKEKVIAYVDQAMYKAKLAGGNRVCFAQKSSWLDPEKYQEIDDAFAGIKTGDYFISGPSELSQDTEEAVVVRDTSTWIQTHDPN